MGYLAIYVGGETKEICDPHILLESITVSRLSEST